MNQDRWRFILFGLLGIGLILFVLPVVPRVVSLAKNISTLQEDRGADLLVDHPDEGHFVSVSPDSLLDELVTLLAGDRPNELGDLKLSPQAVTGTQSIPFSVSGNTSYEHTVSTLARLNRLWPAVHVTTVKLAREKEADLLKVEIAGELRYLDKLPLKSLHYEAPAVPLHDPFTLTVKAPVRPATIQVRNPEVETAEIVAAVIPVVPRLQGTGTLGGNPVAFYEGRAYRVGDVVAQRKILSIQGGNVSLGVPGGAQ
ncbi:MAG: hypothetical protein HKN21_17140 [Candidatus Eisenbacteria bacterium]|uniref:Uncharacterized protein n=1 Tax=Eiseniibacteriota bacterium TaxID=2212470 RepID=A0A7Y2EEH1_UNCEI|nr:hypothetical protein [Candidatus Eisenbacteria bacterium]